VAGLLRAQGYSLQGTRKTLEGAQHPDRDAQFGYLNDQATAYLAAGQPVISVDAKKKGSTDVSVGWLKLVRGAAGRGRRDSASPGR
jgi:hypothetical protein